MLPENGSFLEFNTKRSILKKISITEKDKQDYSISSDESENKITWNIEKDLNTPLVVDFTSDEVSYLKKSIEKLNESGAQYPDDFWAIAEKLYNS